MLTRLCPVWRQLEEAVTTAHETSDAFSDETLREQAVFQHAKKAEMKEMLGRLADGQTEMYKAVRNPGVPSQRWSDMLFLAEHGGMGENHPYNTAYTRGRVASNSEDLGIFSDVMCGGFANSQCNFISFQCIYVAIHLKCVLHNKYAMHD